jgi:hypothetical protein
MDHKAQTRLDPILPTSQSLAMTETLQPAQMLLSRSATRVESGRCQAAKSADEINLEQNAPLRPGKTMRIGGWSHGFPQYLSSGKLQAPGRKGVETRNLAQN